MMDTTGSCIPVLAPHSSSLTAPTRRLSPLSTFYFVSSSFIFSASVKMSRIMFVTRFFLAKLGQLVWMHCKRMAVKLFNSCAPICASSC